MQNKKVIANLAAITNDNSMKVLISIFFILFSLSGCSLFENQEDLASQNQQKTYSSSTEDLFYQIEHGDVFNPKKPAIDQALMQKKSSKTQASKPTQLTISKKLSPYSKEKLIEINQILSLYCMKKHYQKEINTEAKCLVYTDKVLAECLEKNSNINSNLSACIKQNLKKLK